MNRGGGEGKKKKKKDILRVKKPDQTKSNLTHFFFLKDQSSHSCSDNQSINKISKHCRAHAVKSAQVSGNKKGKNFFFFFNLV